MASDEKTIVNMLYHGVSVSALAIEFVCLGKMALGGSLPRLDPSPCDAGFIVMDVSHEMATKQNHAVLTFSDVDKAICIYSQVTNQALDLLELNHSYLTSTYQARPKTKKS